MAKYEIKDGVGIIPEGTTVIENYAFDDSTELTSVVIPDSVTKIGDSAFNGSGLINIVIPKSVKNIGLDAFMDCNNCVSISVMGPVNFLQYNVFANCMKLETITFGTGIKKIDPGFLKVYNKNSDNVRIGSKYDFPPTLKAIYVPAKKTDYYKQRLPQFLHSIIVEKQ